MKPGHIKQSEYENSLRETWTHKQSEYEEKLHEARTH